MHVLFSNWKLKDRCSELKSEYRKVEEEISAIQVNFDMDKSQNKKLHIDLNHMIFQKQRVLVRYSDAIVIRLQTILVNKRIYFFMISYNID
jgi:hypothetical protein